MRTSMLAVFAALPLLTPPACDTAGPGGHLTDVPLVTLDGDRTTLAELTKGRVVLLKFGATWCGWCTKQHREFNKVIEAYGDKVLVLDIDIREPAAKVKAYSERHGFKATTVLDPTGQAANTYGVEGIPHTIIADQEGTILFQSYYVPFARLKPILDRALAARKGV